MAFWKKEISNTETDDIPEKIHKRLRLIYFFLKCVIGVFIFMIFYGFLCVHLLDVPEMGDIDSPFLKHQYCGTFYVEINKDNSFASQEAYEAYLQKLNEEPVRTAAEIVPVVIALAAAAAVLIMLLTKKLPKFLSKRAAFIFILYGACLVFIPDLLSAGSVLPYIILILALRSGDKKRIFKDKASDYFFFAGIIWLAANIFTEIKAIHGLSSEEEGMSGVFSHSVYYCQLYDIFVIPLVILCAGLMLRRYELDLNGGDTARNSSILKAAGYALLAGTGAFLLYRLPVRIYELAKVMSGSVYTVKLPFTVLDTIYNKLIDLPPELASSPQVYKNAVLYRFVKDLPVFILSAAAVYFFAKVLFAMAKGELNTSRNRKYLNTSMIILAAASLWFNLMGIPELDIFNEGFTGIYGEVVFTMALRSKTEPMLYALVLWFFKTYLQVIPESNTKV